MNSESPIRIKVWGDYACFTRPEMKAERVSYDVITPSAARGILEAIYWKPEVRWIVDRIRVLNPIAFTNLRRNEVGVKGSASTVRKAMKGDSTAVPGIVIETTRQQRASTILTDVGYVLEARFELLSGTHPMAKHYNIVKRRAERGQCFHQPYLGTREFSCGFEWVEGESPIPDDSLNGSRDLGYMLHDIEYSASTGKTYDVIESGAGTKLWATPRFFRAVMVDGVVEVPAMSSPESRS